MGTEQVSSQNIPPEARQAVVKRRKVGGRPSASITSEVTAEELELQLQPIFTEQELLAIQDQWSIERVAKEQRKVALQREELRIQSLMQSPEAERIIIGYEQVFNRSPSGIPANVFSSRDDLIILLRHVVDTRFIGISKEEQSSTSIRESIISIQPKQLNSSYLLKPVERFFPSFREALTVAYPTLDLQIFEFNRVPNGYWEAGDVKRRCSQLINWFVDECLKIDKIAPFGFRERVLADVSPKLHRSSFRGAISKAGYSTLADAIIDTYPELKLKPWEFRKGGVWIGERGKQMAVKAVRWLVEERFGLSPQSNDFRGQVTRINARHFFAVGLASMLQAHSHIEAIIFAYPELDLNERDFPRLRRNTWTGERSLQRGMNDVRSLVEDQLGLDPTQPQNRAKILELGPEVFVEHGLGGMLGPVFDYSPRIALQTSYPELGLKDWEFPKVPGGFWNENNYANVRKALRWLVEEKLKILPDSEQFRERLLSITENQHDVIRKITHATRLKFFQVLRIAYPELDIQTEEFIKANPMRNSRSIENNVDKEEIAPVSPEEANEDLDRLLEG